MTALLTLLLSAVLLFTSGCADERSSAEDAGRLKERPLVELHSCQRLPVDSILRSYGNIEPVRKAEVLPPMTGILTRMYSLEGESVNRGDKLAELDTRALELQLSQQKSAHEGSLAALALAREKYRKALRDTEARFLSIGSAEAEAGKARAELERMKDILEQKKKLYLADGITKEEFQSAQLALMEKQTLADQADYSLDSLMIGFREEDLFDAGINIPDDSDDLKALYLKLNTRMELAECDLAAAELKRTERQIASLELKISECTITSPMKGIVGRRYKDEGEQVSPDKALYTIYPSDPVHALASLSEGDLLKIRQGMKARVISDTAKLEREGKVERISPWISSDTRSGELRIGLDNGDGLFRVGQFVRIEMIPEEKSFLITIPSSALVGRPGDSGSTASDRDTGESLSEVFLLKGERIFRKQISTGPPGEGGIPVLQGLEEKDRIVLNPLQTFCDGMEVRLK